MGWRDRLPLRGRLDALVSDAMLQRALRQRDVAAQVAQELGLRRAAQLAARLLRESEGKLGEFAPWQREVLGAVLQRMCAYDNPEGSPELPTPRAVGALDAAIEFTRHMPQAKRQQLIDVTTLIEIGPRVFGPQRGRGRFTRLDARAKDEYLRGWEESSLAPRRAAFHGLKAVCMMGYWTREETWGAIGYGLEREGDDV
ncbi:MAG: hypothetical protein AAGI01_11925 [Myxococcota bacterium]